MGPVPAEPGEVFALFDVDIWKLMLLDILEDDCLFFFLGNERITKKPALTRKDTRDYLSAVAVAWVMSRRALYCNMGRQFHHQ